MSNNYNFMRIFSRYMVKCPPIYGDGPLYYRGGVIRENPPSQAKHDFEVNGKRFLKYIAIALGIDDACDIRFNPGGNGVSGDCSLHGEHIYIHFNADFLGGDRSILYRTCKGRKDYAGGGNRYIEWDEFANNPELQVAKLAACNTKTFSV